ncbi:MAG: ABC transporter permease [Elusimicrobia bacterium]|nr:ABC transporter permease [Elusimicrobiota bacterium]
MPRNTGKRLLESFTIIKHNRRAFFGLCVLVFFILMATAGPVVIPLDMSQDFLMRFQGPSWAHILGTDFAGRDIFQQLVHGSTDVLTIAFATAFFGSFIAVLVGLSAGLVGGKFDMLMMRIIDIFLTVPNFPIMIIFASIFRINDPISFALVLAAWSWPGLARALRAQVLSLKHKEFVEVSRVMAMPYRHIMFKEALPGLMPYLMINFIDMARGAITASVGIMLLGLVPLSVTNWGMMLNFATFQTGAIYVPSALSYLLSPMLAIILFQYGLICFASGVEEIFDPRLRS